MTRALKFFEERRRIVRREHPERRNFFKTWKGKEKRSGCNRRTDVNRRQEEELLFVPVPPERQRKFIIPIGSK